VCVPAGVININMKFVAMHGQPDRPVQSAL
jgi:hypothetical protein